MTRQNLPGFSAETTLVRRRPHYQHVAWDAPAKASGALIPALTEYCIESVGADGTVTRCCCNDSRCFCWNASAGS